MGTSKKKKAVVSAKKEPHYVFETDKPEPKAKYTVYDLVAVLLITAVTAVISFAGLGDRVAPQTFWTPVNGETAVIEFYDVTTVSELQLYRGGVHDQTMSIAFSIDGHTWTEPHVLAWPNRAEDTPFTITFNDVFSWLRDNEAALAHLPAEDRTGRFVKVISDSDRLRIGQIGFRTETGGDLVPIRGIRGEPGAAELINAQELIPVRRTFMNSTYFDEIYHPRAAYEFVNGLPIFETTHPHLGKLIMAFFVNIFGMTPFGWRFAGTLFGVLLVPFIYLFARDMFSGVSGNSRLKWDNGTFWASFAAVLFAFDFMRFAQTRLPTIDTYNVFFVILMFYFMYKYYQTSFFQEKFWKTLVPLFFSGLFMGLGIASKWQGVYAAVGLAVVFFIVMLKRYMEYKDAKRRGDKEFYERFRPLFIKTGWWCVLFFIVIPATIYIVCHIPYFIVGNLGYGDVRAMETWVKEAYGVPLFLWTVLPDNAVGNFFLDFVVHQAWMLWYHGVHIPTLEPHHWASPWWQWVLNLRPLFLYANSAADGLRSGMSTFGNPVVWWGGFVSIIACLGVFATKYSKITVFLLVAYLAQLLPWVLVPRMAWIYHYFASVPFMILFTVYAFKMLTEKLAAWLEKKGYTSVFTPHFGKMAAVVYAAAAITLFAVFHPVLAGIPIDPEFVRANLQWFAGWQLI